MAMIASSRGMLKAVEEAGQAVSAMEVKGERRLGKRRDWWRGRELAYAWKVEMAWASTRSRS